MRGGSVPGADWVLANIEPVVQADFDQMDVLSDIDVGGRGKRKACRSNSERARPGAKVHVVVLELPGDAVGEGELDAGTEHPAPSPVLVLDAESPEAIDRVAGRRDLVPLVRPGQTALHVQHGTVDGATEPYREAAERVDIGSAGGLSEKEGTSVAAANAGPAALRLDAPHPRSALVVVTDLHAAEESVDAVVVDRRVVEGEDPCFATEEGKDRILPLLRPPGAADMHADVPAGPAEDRNRRRRRLVDRTSHVGCPGRPGRHHHRNR